MSDGTGRRISLVVSKRWRTVEIEDLPRVLTELEARRLHFVLALALEELDKSGADGLRVLPGGLEEPPGGA